MNDDCDFVREGREEREREAKEKRLNDQYWQQLESRSGYDEK